MSSYPSAIIFDFNCTLFDPEQSKLFPDALTCLQNCTLSHHLFLVSRFERNRVELFSRLGIEGFFQQIHLVEQKSRQLFEHIGTPYTHVYVVGDMVTEEIRYGNQCGYTTIWLKRAMHPAKRLVRDEIPTHTIHTLQDLGSIIR